MKKSGSKETQHCSMKKEHIEQLRTHIVYKIKEHTVMKTRDKKAETALAKYIAMFILSYTGCRPKEAAYIVHANSFELNKVPVADYVCKYIATAPRAITKTSRDYLWQLKPELDWIVPIVKRLVKSKLPKNWELMYS